MIEPIITKSNNTYIISNKDTKECVVVDPGLDFMSYAKKIKANYKVVAILITHGHIDHIDGIKYFECPVYIHEADEKMLYDDKLSLYSVSDKKNPFKLKKPQVITVKDGDTFDLVGYTFSVLHTPGHTAGSVCYSYKDKVIAGDTLFRGSCGRTDLPTGDEKAMKESLKKIVETYPGNYKVYPGHNALTTIREETIANPYLK